MNTRLARLLRRPPKRIFLSYGSELTEFGERLAAFLRDQSYEVSTFVDAYQQADWRKAVATAIAEAESVVLCIGKNPSEAERGEWSLVLESFWRDAVKTVVPVLVGGVGEPSFLRGIESVRISRTLSEKEAFDRILRLTHTKVDFGSLNADELHKELVDRLDVTIDTLLEEQPDDDELREHRDVLEDSLRVATAAEDQALAHLNIGLVDLKLHSHNSALTHLNEALRICEENNLQGYPNRVAILLPLADALAELERFEQASETLEEAVALRKEHEGNDSPGVIAASQELGALLVRAGRYAQASQILERTLKVNRSALGSDHPRVMADEFWLAIANREQQEDRPSLITAQATEDNLAEDPPLPKIMHLLGLGYTLIVLEDLATAREVLYKAVTLAESSVQVQDSTCALCTFYLGIALLRDGSWREASTVFHRAADLNASAGQGMGRATALYYEGFALRKMGELDEAEEVLMTSLEATKQEFGAGSRRVAEHFYNLALIHRDRAEHATARRLLEDAIEISTAKVGGSDPRVLKYGRALERLDQASSPQH